MEDGTDVCWGEVLVVTRSGEKDVDQLRARPSLIRPKRGIGAYHMHPKFSKKSLVWGRKWDPRVKDPVVPDDVVRAQIPQVDSVPPVGEPEGRIGDDPGGGV